MFQGPFHSLFQFQFDIFQASYIRPGYLQNRTFSKCKFARTEDLKKKKNPQTKCKRESRTIYEIKKILKRNSDNIKK